MIAKKTGFKSENLDDGSCSDYLAQYDKLAQTE